MDVNGRLHAGACSKAIHIKLASSKVRIVLCCDDYVNYLIIDHL